MSNKNYNIQAVGKKEASANSELEKMIKAANKKLQANGQPLLAEPDKTEYSITTKVDEQRTFVDPKDFEGAVAKADKKLRAYEISSYGITQTYKVTPNQLEALQSTGVKGEKKSPTAGPFVNGVEAREDITAYMR